MADQMGGDAAGAAGPVRPLERATRQCEVELLISGIAVFAMVQLAGVMDDAIFRLRPRFAPEWTSLLVLLYVYGKGAAVLLAATFAVHLLLRARWIALAGMHVICPGGVDWSRMKMGPIGLAAEAEAMGSIPEAVARADRRATIVFTVGVMIASVLVVLFVLVALAIGVPMALLARLGMSLDPTQVMLFALVAMLPFFVANFIDTTRGARLDPGGRAVRLLRRTFSVYRRIGMSATSNPAFALLTSHQGQQRTFMATLAIILGTTVAVMAGYVAMRSEAPLGSYGAFPDASGGVAPSVVPATYDDQRDPLRDRPTPFIDGAVATGPFVRLRVPFEPDRDTPAMRAHCPGALAAASGPDAAVSAAERLACLSRLHPVTLDGAPVAVDYVPARDHRTDRPALLAMIDVRGLAPGLHVLVVERPPRHRRDGTPRDTDTDPAVRIPFWR